MLQLGKLEYVLKQSAHKLEESSMEICADRSFVHDTIYLAVIKTKQKYKKLANKERAVEVCISLMRQPRKHVKQSFTSVEDCIEKALAAKVVPWKPIVSAVAVVLAAAIILPFYLPKKPTYTDPKGFVMDGTQTFVNNVAEYGVFLQNYHKLSDLGGPTMRDLAGYDFKVDSQAVRYDTLTTVNGETFLLAAYVNADTKVAEFILYKAHIDGWHEVGKDTIEYVVTSVAVNGEQKSFFNINHVALLSDEDGTVYVLTSYNEGLQIHEYTTNGKFQLCDQISLHSHSQLLSSGKITTDHLGSIDLCYNKATNHIDIVCSIAVDAYSSKPCFLSFDLKTKTFDQPTYPGEALSAVSRIDSLCADADGNLYFVAICEEFKGNLITRVNHYIYRVKEGEITPFAHFLDNTRYSILFLAYNNGLIHLVYQAGTTTYHEAYDTNGAQLTKEKVLATTKDTHRTLFYFVMNGHLHFVEEIDNTYVTIGKKIDGDTVKIAEFRLPAKMDGTVFAMQHPSPYLSSGNILNYIVGYIEEGDVYREADAHFLQIILE